MAAFERQQALERERSRIARDMHDGLGSSMVKIAMLGDLLEDNLRTEHPRDPNPHPAGKQQREQVRSQAQRLTAAARQVVREMDEVVWTINPKNDTLENLAGYIGQFAREHFADTGIECHLEIPTQMPDLMLTAEVRHNLFMAAKEGLNNILRHAEASEIWVHLQADPFELTLSIRDNGRGLGTGPSPRVGHGRANMEDRLNRIGGRLMIESPIGQTSHGTHLIMIVPLESAHSAR
jgi:signal transduction histidine kinase